MTSTQIQQVIMDTFSPFSATRFMTPITITVESYESELVGVFNADWHETAKHFTLWLYLLFKRTWCTEMFELWRAVK